MREPVIAADGEIYEQEALKHWFHDLRQNRSPMSNVTLRKTKDLVPLKYSKEKSMMLSGVISTSLKRNRFFYLALILAFVLMLFLMKI